MFYLGVLSKLFDRECLKFLFLFWEIVELMCYSNILCLGVLNNNRGYEFL